MATLKNFLRTFFIRNSLPATFSSGDGEEEVQARLYLIAVGDCFFD